jgi:predicted regulator of Ras-like GTPase activity (Roadblock/LC7/MglB family)
MSFRELIEEMHRKDPSILGGALAGSDGLTVEEWRSDGDGGDIPALCAELVHLYKDADRVALENGLGGVQEFHMTAGAGQVCLRKVTDDYFLVIVAKDDAVAGRCRFLLRQGARRARELL